MDTEVEVLLLHNNNTFCVFFCTVACFITVTLRSEIGLQTAYLLFAEKKRLLFVLMEERERGMGGFLSII